MTSSLHHHNVTAPSATFLQHLPIAKLLVWIQPDIYPSLFSPQLFPHFPPRYFSKRQLNLDKKKNKLQTAGKARALYLMPRVAYYLSTQAPLLGTAMGVVSKRTTVTEAKAPSPVKTQVKASLRQSLEHVAAMEVEHTTVEAQLRAKLEDLEKAHVEATEKLREAHAEEVNKLTGENRKLTNVVAQRRREPQAHQRRRPAQT